MANPSWQPNSIVKQFAVIVDPSGNVQQAVIGGQTGLQPPQFNEVQLGAQTQDGQPGQNPVTWQLVAIFTPTSPPSGLLPALPLPTFVNDADGLNPNLILADMISQFQAASGRTLQPAQVERLMINAYAYRESLVRNAIQFAAQQCLVAFASFPILDYLGQLLSVTRLPAQPALTVLQFTLLNALTVPKTIPAGTLVGTSDGAFTFATTAALTIAAGQTLGSVGAVCTTPGSGGSGYLAGQINVLLNPDALIGSVANTTTSAGGSSPETDDHLRARIQAAPSQFSAAGPAAAYKFFALSVSPTIIDALVTTPVPGTVNVYLLTGPVTQPASSPNSQGIASGGLIAQALASLSGDTVRPLTDTVNVLPVTEVDYAIIATVTLFADADVGVATAAVNQAAQQFALNLASRIERDIVLSEIIAALMVPGVYSVELASPAATVPLTAGQWANCTSIALTVVSGTEHS